MPQSSPRPATWPPRPPARPLVAPPIKPELTHRSLALARHSPQSQAKASTLACSAASRERESAMGKKSGRGGEKNKGEEAAKARAFTLKVAMHCHCDGCTDKIRAAVKDLTLLQGIERVDQTALETKGEVRLLATADPEKLRQRLHKATRKNVDLLLPKEPKPDKTDAAQALLNALQAQYAAGQGAWGNQLLPGNGVGAGGSWNAHGGYGYGAAAAAPQAYPWAAQQQPDPYAAAAYPGAYPAAAGAWGAYAYPPAAQGHGGAWHGY